MDYRNLGNTCVLGLQWGDEGKGKIVDLLTEHFDIVVRYGGGANAGHTVRIGAERYALHLLPSGVLRPDVLNLIGPGVAVDLEILTREIADLRARGIDVSDRLRISSRAHLVMPYHKKQDLLNEARLGASRRIGTTAKGIGPCYADKMLRSTALRLADLYRPESFREKLSTIVADRNAVFAALYGDTEPLEAGDIAGHWLGFADEVAGQVADTTHLLHEALGDGRRVLFEGAQGAMLDVNHGTYPFVTSTVCTAAGVAAGAGVPPSALDTCLGVIKAYSTRVGGGPFPTELTDATGDAIRERGREYGTTTGRPRRCGWFDAFAVRYAIALSGVDRLAVMHLDTLGSFPELCICTGYRRRGQAVPFFPAEAAALEECEPIYEVLPGWREEITGVESFEQLPAAARRYVERLESLLETPVTIVSIGAERTETLHRGARQPEAAPMGN